MSLIEALNGPYTPRTAMIPPESPDTPDTDTASAIQAAETLNRYLCPIYMFKAPSETRVRRMEMSPCGGGSAIKRIINK